MQKITILGATGSIGISTLDVVSRYRDLYELYALTANSSYRQLTELCIKYQPKYAVIQEAYVAPLNELLKANRCSTQVLAGDSALIEVSVDSQVDIVMAAIVGAAGLLPTFKAVEAGKKVLLANKESLVMAGALFMNAAAKARALLLPIDSEHNAMFQCMPLNHKSISASGIRRLLLTGSGGPFRQWSKTQIANASPQQACNHPNWSMGPKISVDSASLMNKGLELIEACWLFDIEPSKVDIVIHPQSVIHSMVEYIDGSVLAQMGNPDMRTPIAHALAWPERMESGVASLDILATARLDFEPPDLERFPMLSLAIAAAHSKGAVATILNAANEVAVDAFLAGSISFAQMYDVVAATLDSIENRELIDLESVQHVDYCARQYAINYVKGQQ